jgi:hypothetical protein
MLDLRYFIDPIGSPWILIQGRTEWACLDYHEDAGSTLMNFYQTLRRSHRPERVMQD